MGGAQAELGRLDEAKDVFGDVQAAVASSGGFLQIPDVYINMANVALAKQVRWAVCCSPRPARL